MNLSLLGLQLLLQGLHSILSLLPPLLLLLKLLREERDEQRQDFIGAG